MMKDANEVANTDIIRVRNAYSMSTSYFTLYEYVLVEIGTSRMQISLNKFKVAVPPLTSQVGLLQNFMYSHLVVKSRPKCIKIHITDH